MIDICLYTMTSATGNQECQYEECAQFQDTSHAIRLDLSPADAAPRCPGAEDLLNQPVVKVSDAAKVDKI